MIMPLMMREITLQMLMIFVPDLVKAKDFYCGTLGFDLTSEDERQLEFSFSNGKVVAFKCEKDGRVGDYGNEARSVFVFRVPDLDAMMAHMRRINVRFLHDVPAQTDLGRYAAFVDPFGNVHELYEEIAA